MGKKKWSGPNERKRHNKHKSNQKKQHQNKNADQHRGKGKPFVKNNYSNSEKPVKTWTPKNSLFEKQIGVTEYVGKTPGFTGVIKARFSDFQVNEIDLDGNVVKLTSTTLPIPPKNNDADLTENQEAVIKLITAEKWEKIKEVSSSKPDLKLFVELDVDSLTKEQRSLIHITVKESFGQSLIGSTFEKSSKKHIKLARYTKGDLKDNRTKWVWPHEYTYFVLHKENVDTMKAASDLAHNLNTKASSLAYAGTKDKRGKTTQWFCMRKREPEKIARAAERFPNVYVGNFTFKPETLKLGLLKGNRFRIALRHIVAEEKDIEPSLAYLKDNGFINYYGLQRFGNNAEIPTHQIGLALLRGEFKEACELILKPRGNEPYFMTQVREHWWKNRDAAAALKLLFKSNTGVESKLLTGLARNGKNDFINALENVPRNMRLLYIHAYQSLVWNEIVSRRVQLGLSVKVGDLVYSHTDDTSVAEECTEVVADLSTTIDEDEEEDENTDSPDDKAEPSKFKTMVRQLTEDDVKSGRFSIFDIVLPLPGHDITYPSNECGDWYIERLAKDNLSPEKLKQKQKAYSLTGAYRKLIVKPENMTWYFMKYSNETDNLIQSDLEELKMEPKPENIEDGKLKALIIDFCLPSSTYATMFLREILKEDTSAANQTKINQKESEENCEKPDKDEDIEKVSEDNPLLANNKEEKVAEKRKIDEAETADDSKRPRVEIN